MSDSMSLCPSSATISSDGSLAATVVASSSSRTSVQVYQLSSSSCQLQLTLTHPAGNLHELVFVNNNSILAGRFGKSQIVVWDLDRGVVAQTLTTSHNDQWFVGLATTMKTTKTTKTKTTTDTSTTHGSSLYVLVQYGRKLQVQEYACQNNTTSGSVFKMVRKLKSGKHEGGNHHDDDQGAPSYRRLAVSSKHVCAQTCPSEIRVMDLSSGKKVGKIKAKDGAPRICTLVLLENLVAVGFDSGMVTLYDVSTCKSIVKIPRPSTTLSNMQLETRDDGYSLLVDTSLYTVHSNKHQLSTEISSSKHPTALFLTTDQKLLAIILDKSTGARARWLTIKDDMEPKNLDLDEKAKGEDTVKETAKRKPNQPVILGPGQAGTESAPPTKRAKRGGHDDGDGNDEEGQSESIEVSVAERLKQLSEALDEEDDDDDDDNDGDESSPAVSFKPRQATTESLKEFLSQALQSGDESLLELALGVNDVKVISTTLKEIEPSLIVVLLGRLTTRLASNPLRAESLAVWMSFCLKTGRFQPQHLAPLRNLLYERIENFADLLRLEGRLSLMCDVE